MTDFHRWHYELYSDAVVTYRMEKGSQKKIGKSITPIAKDEMKAFIYGPLHREIFEGAICKGHEDLIHKITSFINAHRGRTDE